MVLDRPFYGQACPECHLSALRPVEWAHLRQRSCPHQDVHVGLPHQCLAGEGWLDRGYGYTAANRLQTASGIWGALAWSYDGVGNRTSEALTSGSTTTWSYTYPPTSNLLGTVTDGSNVRTFTHDAAGNVTADDRSGTGYNYRYNNRARRDRLTIGSTVTADYTYDGLERLAVRVTQNMTPASTTHYVYDRQGHLIVEADAAGNTLREYVWLDDLPLAVVADVDTLNPKLWFVHADHLDRPLKMTDATQAVVWDAVYRPFGEVVSISGAGSNNLRFPGQYFLIESGLHYNWHRHYDPTIGRHVQADPLGFVDGPSVYAYAASAPITKTDAEGLQSAIGSVRRGPYTPAIPPQVIPGTQEWWDHAKRGHQGLADFIMKLCRKIIGGNDEERCKIERELCHQQCVDYALSHPVGGMRGSDRPGHYRRCMRQCMKEADCPFE